MNLGELVKYRLSIKREMLIAKMTGIWFATDMEEATVIAR